MEGTSDQRLTFVQIRFQLNYLVYFRLQFLKEDCGLYKIKVNIQGLKLVIKRMTKIGVGLDLMN